MTQLDQTWELTEQQSSVALVRRIVVNTMSLLTSDVLNKAATFIVYALVGRYCGARAFGQLSLGLTLLYTFQVFASAGLPSLITRDVAKLPQSAGSYFANAGIIVLCAFFVNLAALVLLVVVSQYPRDTAEVIVVLGLGILPWALATNVEAIFRAREQMHLLALVAIPLNLFKVGLSYFVLLRGGDILDIAFVLLACQTAALICEVVILLREIPMRDIRFNIQACIGMLRRTWKFLGIDGLSAVLACISTVLLSWFTGELAVGLFGAAWQLLMPARLVLLAIINSLFPMMCRRADENNERLQQFTVMVIEIIVLIAAPCSILLYFSADQVIAFLYAHKDFSGSAHVLRILLPVLLLQGIAGALGQLLYSQHREHVPLQIIGIDVVLSILIGVPLIHAYGLTGAAVSVLVVNILNTAMHVWATHHVFMGETGRSSSWRGSLFWCIAAACGVMSVAQIVTGNVNFLIASALAVTLYVIVLAALIYWACRSGNGLQERFLFPLQERNDVRT